MEGSNSVANVQISLPNHWAADDEFRGYFIEIITKAVNELIAAKN